MEKRTTLVLTVICALTVSASISCGGKNPTEPTKGATNAPASAAGDDGSVTALATSSMRWTIADRCYRDRYGYQWRVFDMATKKRYPSSGYYRTPSGGTKTATISCTTGHKMCVGGTSYPATSYQFGVGINGTRRATNLFCRLCGNTSYRLTSYCLAGLAPGEDEWTEETSNLDASESLAEDTEGEEFVIEDE
ncbi:MAG TPA: hypothetical protein VFM88_21445 [Vicinamibacteria bacterium]|nr:hypothetical protein [Vicinamibacteria bacterium]